ncbi:N-acetylmuramoyl-L-alanine amidase [Leptolyngbya sp. BL0902]|uniref:N-acetylmuramoyl-L-alanine amidase n=1 Tax=Leptolyngbya sp. BL0902 TaxID=1115757 RepID=UPI0018E79A22|nr:N-acetylmuramoyl-L-alanine amidase [Leptolyngbya sp. BL0902]QQE63417.1 N-acetylmuramoyl-L-alanine amidase [Leptolyngbya sp. BL0902]
MVSRWLVSGTLGAVAALVVVAPAQAATLQYWWFDAQSNQLIFTTDGSVQPTAQMLANPTRVVVDLPNTQLGGSTRRQSVGGNVREVRAGQFDAQTTRLVIEFAPGYSLDPQAVRVQGVRPNQWVVQLPGSTTNAPGNAAPPTGEATPATITPSGNQVQGNTGTGAAATLNRVTTTGDGFLLHMSGTAPRPTIRFSGNGPDDQVAVLDLPNTAVATTLRPSDLPNFRYSIRTWEVVQQETNPPSTRITLRLAPGSPQWRALSNSSGVVLLPPSGVPISSVPDEPPPPTPVPPVSEVRPTVPVLPPGRPATPPIRPTTPPSQVTVPPTQPTAPPAMPSIPSQRVVVVIDPGHGGRDPGAVGIGGLQEKQVIFPISLRVAELLEQQGVVVVMTRREDITLDLQSRVDIANRARGNIFVSIHANAISMSRPDVNGVETYFASESGRRLAAAIQSNMLAATGMRDRGVKQARFFVIRHTNMPAALVEVGFVTGAQDAPRLADPAWRETAAQAIARGILQYIQQGL